MKISSLRHHVLLVFSVLVADDSVISIEMQIVGIVNEQCWEFNRLELFDQENGREGGAVCRVEIHPPCGQTKEKQKNLMCFFNVQHLKMNSVVYGLKLVYELVSTAPLLVIRSLACMWICDCKLFFAVILIYLKILYSFSSVKDHRCLIIN